jgi:hypothetical protein
MVTRQSMVPSSIWRIASSSLLAWQVGIVFYRARQFRETGAVIPIPRVLRLWVVSVLVLQVLNLHLAVSWPYLLGVFSLLANGFTFFLLLLLGDFEGVESSA